LDLALDLRLPACHDPDVSTNIGRRLALLNSPVRLIALLAPHRVLGCEIEVQAPALALIHHAIRVVTGVGGGMAATNWTCEGQLNHANVAGCIVGYDGRNMAQVKEMSQGYHR
jgi:hypothetical protein